MHRAYIHRARSGPFTMIALVIIGWAMVRSLWVAASWLATASVPHSPPMLPAIAAPIERPAAAIAAASPQKDRAVPYLARRVTVMHPPAKPMSTASWDGFSAVQRALLRSGPRSFYRRSAIAQAPTDLQSPLVFGTARTRPTRQRWSMSAWAFFRPTAPVQPGSGLYGGSQAGARAAYALGDGWQAYGRLSATPATRDSAEGAVGLALRPLSHVPLTLAVERRMRIAGAGRNGFAAYVTGGVSDLPAPAQFSIDAYGAAGIVGASRRDVFAEGFLTARRRVADLGPVRLNAGAGVWGGTQTGISRLDVGPSVALRWEGAPFSLSLDWRQRMAGNSAPASGPAITLSADF